MTLTPMMQQYRDAKEQHPGMILLFRMGDFYELFDDDAEIAAKVLGLALTSRDKTVPMAGFPHHSLEPYLHKLLKSGHRVAICDQIEDASQAKGLVKRAVTRIVTPGTITEDDLLDPRSANYLAAVCVKGKECGLAWVDLSTGQFFATDTSEDQMADEMARLQPSECLFPEELSERIQADLSVLLNTSTLSPRPDWSFKNDLCLPGLLQHFQVKTFAGFGFADDQPCLLSAGALLIYLQETLKSNLSHLHRLRPHHSEDFLILDEVTRRSLELTKTIREGERAGSLLSVIDRTVTAMGARLLHEWLLNPLTDIAKINQRLDAIGELVTEHSLRTDIRDLLQQAFDLQRLTSRVSTGRASPRDLSAIGKTVQLLPKIKAKIVGRKATMLRELENQLELFQDLRVALESALVDDPPLSPKEGGLIRANYDKDLDELREISRGGKEWLAEFQAKEITRTGINSLKVGFNKVFGYYLEVTHTHTDKVPADYVRKQTLKNAERYITPELKEHEEKVLGAEEKSQQREYEIFLQLRDMVAEKTNRLLQTAEILATLDVIIGLTDLAVSRNYCRPNIVSEPVLEIIEGRHPVLDQTLPSGTFVPNDIDLNGSEGYLWLITGPNMSGKSTFIRQVALQTLMAHMGCYLPAQSAKVGITDRIFTRVGASDELSRGHSTFMVEMTEAANILNNATEKSLVILDEIGRGTSTYDGVSLAWAITEHLHSQIRCRGLFATHYHELAQLAETLPGLRNYNVEVQEWQDEIVFLHKIGKGSADKSYGIHVAQLAGIPVSVLERAQAVLADLEAHHVQTKSKRIPVRPRSQRPDDHMTLFD